WLHHGRGRVTPLEVRRPLEACQGGAFPAVARRPADAPIAWERVLIADAAWCAGWLWSGLNAWPRLPASCSRLRRLLRATVRIHRLRTDCRRWSIERPPRRSRPVSRIRAPPDLADRRRRSA